MKYFAVMNLTKGCYRCEIDKSSSRYTASISSTGVIEWPRVPMGITAAPSYFQRTIANESLHGLVGFIGMVYIDESQINDMAKDRNDESHTNEILRSEGIYKRMLPV